MLKERAKKNVKMRFKEMGIKRSDLSPKEFRNLISKEERNLQLKWGSRVGIALLTGGLFGF